MSGERRRSVVVTGGTSGIGLGIAAAFAAASAEVLVIGRDPARGERAAHDHPGIRFVAADVRDATAVEQALATVGRIDVLVNAAAGNFPCPAAALSPNGFRSVVEIDLIGTFTVCRLAFDQLAKPGALILNISAPQATTPTPFQVHACAAKAGVEMVTRCLALEWGPLGVRVVSLTPGVVEGTLGVERLAVGDGTLARLREVLPLGRFSDVAEVARTAMWLASDAAPSLTGTTLVVDGGLSVAGGAFSRVLTKGT